MCVVWVHVLVCVFQTPARTLRSGFVYLCVCVQYLVERREGCWYLQGTLCAWCWCMCVCECVCLCILMCMSVCLWAYICVCVCLCYAIDFCHIETTKKIMHVCLLMLTCHSMLTHTHCHYRLATCALKNWSVLPAPFMNSTKEGTDNDLLDHLSQNDWSDHLCPGCLSKKQVLLQTWPERGYTMCP